MSADLPLALATAPFRPGAEPAVRVGRLNHVFYKGETATPVLKGIDLVFAPGEVVILTGPSGCGKTTLLTLVGGLRSLQPGSSVCVRGRELCGLGPRELMQVRLGIGFIFQRHNLFASLTAYQNVMMGLELHGWPHDQADRRIIELLTLLKLGERVHYKPKGLSGGQCQRVAIARALAYRPKLVLADEPTAALDEESGRIAFEELRRMADQEGTTVIIVTHDDRILEGADRIVSLRYGRVASNLPVREAKQICEFLNHCDLFGGLTLMTLADVIETMRRAEFAPGETIIRQGERGDRFYLIRSGEVEGHGVREDGSEFRFRLGEGQFFGERALATEEPRNATVTARGPVVTYTLDKADFTAAREKNPRFADQLRTVFALRQ